MFSLCIHIFSDFSGGIGRGDIGDIQQLVEQRHEPFRRDPCYMVLAQVPWAHQNMCLDTWIMDMMQPDA